MAAPSIHNVQNAADATSILNYAVGSEAERVLGVIVTTEGDPASVTDVTFGGTSLTEIDTVLHPPTGFQNLVSVWYMADPSGTADIQVTGPTTAGLTAFYLSGADTTSVPDSFQTGTSGSSPNSISIDPTADDSIVISAFSQGNPDDFSLSGVDATIADFAVDNGGAGVTLAHLAGRTDVATGQITVDCSLVTGTWNRSAAILVAFAPSSIPIFQSGSVDSAGTTYSATFSEAVTRGVNFSASNVVLNASGGAVTLTYASGDGTSTLNFTTSRTIEGWETLTHDYTQPGNGIEASDDGTDVASYSGKSVTNNATLAEVDIPAQADFSTTNTIISSGGVGAWDERFAGDTPSSTIRFGNAFYLYYIGAAGDRSSDGGPSQRAVGLATCPATSNPTDSANWTKSASNPVIPWTDLQTNNNDEEGAWMIAAYAHGDEIILYVGVLKEVTASTVGSDIHLFTSTDGETFTDQGAVVSRTDSFVPGAQTESELGPIGVFQDDAGTWHMYILHPDADGTIANWSVQHLTGSARDTFTAGETVDELGSTSDEYRQGGDLAITEDASATKAILPVALADGTGRFDVLQTTDTDFGAVTLADTWLFNASQSALYLDRDTSEWLFFHGEYGDDSTAIYVRTAPVTLAGAQTALQDAPAALRVSALDAAAATQPALQAGQDAPAVLSVAALDATPTLQAALGITQDRPALLRLTALDGAAATTSLLVARQDAPARIVLSALGAAAARQAPHALQQDAPAAVRLLGLGAAAALQAPLQAAQDTPAPLRLLGLDASGALQANLQTGQDAPAVLVLEALDAGARLVGLLAEQDAPALIELLALDAQIALQPAQAAPQDAPAPLTLTALDGAAARQAAVGGAQDAPARLTITALDGSARVVIPRARVVSAGGRYRVSAEAGGRLRRSAEAGGHLTGE